MSKEYSVGGDGLTLANQAVTLVFINPQATITEELNILRLWCSQSGTATSAMLRVEAETQPVSFPALVSATPRQLKTGDTVASLIVGGTAGAAGTAGINASAEGSGSKTTRFGDNFNNLNGYLWVPTPRELITLAYGFTSGFGLFFPVAAGSLTGWAVGLNYAEGQ